MVLSYFIMSYPLLSYVFCLGVSQPELVTCIEKHLRPGGTLFMQSDVLDVVRDMRVITRESAGK